MTTIKRLFVAGAFWRALASRSRASGAAVRTRHAENEPR